MPSRNNLPQRKPRWLALAVGGILAILLTGCAINPPKVVKLYPPVDLVQDCLRTEVFIAKNKDLAVAYQTRDADLTRCNTDKAALRDWMNLGGLDGSGEQSEP